MHTSSKSMLIVAVIVSFFIGSPVIAADYPSHPIKMITMVKPGAQIDLLARKVAEELKNELGQPVLVSNNPGGSHGSVMAAELSRAKPDGYTLGIGATAAYTYSPHYVKTNYKFDDFTFISMLGLNQSGIVCRPDRPWKTLGDAFAWAKKEGKGLTYMFQGSDDRDVMMRIAAQEGVNLSLMPSQGGPSIISAVMGGHADLGHLGAILFGYVPQKLTLLAATTPTRLKAPPELKDFPDVPTLQEQGWDESVEMFIALIGPDGLPEATLARLEEAIAKLADDKEFQEFIAVKLKMGPVTYGRKYAEEYMKKAYDRFGAQAKKMKKK